MKVTSAHKFFSFSVTYATSFEFAEDLPRWLAKGFTFSQSLSEARPASTKEPVSVNYQSYLTTTVEEAGL